MSSRPGEDGLFKIHREALKRVNGLGQMMIASRHGDVPVKRGDKLAATRIIPLVIEKEKMEEAQRAAGEEPIFEILPFKQKRLAWSPLEMKFTTSALRTPLPRLLSRSWRNMGLR